MTSTTDEVNGFINQDAKEKPGVPLDGYDRYLIVPEGADKAVPHTRATTVAKVMEDSHGLTNWKVRLTAVGLSRRRDLYARVSSMSDPEGTDKKALNKLCVEAQEAAGSRAKSNIGTSMHSWAEQLDRGDAPNVPEEWAGDLEAYRSTLHRAGVGIIPEFIEQLVVLPDLGIAGTADRFVDFGVLPKAADIKTGQIRENVVIQLAIYAHAKTRYDWRTKTHTPMPEVDQDVALLIHLPEGQGRCDLYWVDIAAGWEAVQLALQVREWRKRKGLIDFWDLERLDVVVERRVAFEERIETLRQIPGALQRLALAWPPGVPTFKKSPTHTPDQLNLIDQALTAVEAQVRAPFGPLDNKENQ